MPKKRPDNEVKKAMWQSLLEAAKSYHNHPSDHGMIAIIARDAGVTKAAVSDWKNQVSYPEDARLRKLADLYGVSTPSISGYQEPDYEGFGSPNELLQRASDLTEMVCRVLLPDGSMDEYIQVMSRTHELLLEGMTDVEVRGQLFFEFGVKPKDDTPAEPSPND